MRFLILFLCSFVGAVLGRSYLIIDFGVMYTKAVFHTTREFFHVAFPEQEKPGEIRSLINLGVTPYSVGEESANSIPVILPYFLLPQKDLAFIKALHDLYNVKISSLDPAKLQMDVYASKKSDHSLSIYEIFGLYLEKLMRAATQQLASKKFVTEKRITVKIMTPVTAGIAYSTILRKYFASSTFDEVHFIPEYTYYKMQPHSLNILYGASHTTVCLMGENDKDFKKCHYLNYGAWSSELLLMCDIAKSMGLSCDELTNKRDFFNKVKSNLKNRLFRVDHPKTFEKVTIDNAMLNKLFESNTAEFLSEFRKLKTDPEMKIMAYGPSNYNRIIQYMNEKLNVFPNSSSNYNQIVNMLNNRHVKWTPVKLTINFSTENNSANVTYANSPAWVRLTNDTKFLNLYADFDNEMAAQVKLKNISKICYRDVKDIVSTAIINFDLYEKPVVKVSVKSRLYTTFSNVKKDVQIYKARVASYKYDLTNEFKLIRELSILNTFTTNLQDSLYELETFYNNLSEIEKTTLSSLGELVEYNVSSGLWFVNDQLIEFLKNSVVLLEKAMEQIVSNNITNSPKVDITKAALDKQVKKLEDLKGNYIVRRSK